MASKTTNYNLSKPSYNDNADIAVINSNMDIIDTKMKEIEDKVTNDELNLSVIGNMKQYVVGSDTQSFTAGDNDLTVVTDLPAGLYLFTVNGVHETSGQQYIVQNIEFIAGDARVRNYYGGSNPTTAMACAIQIPQNAIIGISIRANDNYTTYSVWNIQAIRLK